VARERRADVHAGARVLRDLEEDVVAELNASAGSELIPVEPFDRHVFPDRSRHDRVPLRLERENPLVREETDGAVRPAVVLVIPLPVAFDTEACDPRARYPELRHATRRHADLDDPSFLHHRTSIPMPRA